MLVTKEKKMKNKKIILASVLALMLFSSNGLAEERFDHGKAWLGSSVGEKMNYMTGYTAGYTIGVMNAVKNFMPTSTDQEKDHGNGHRRRRSTSKTTLGVDDCL